MISVVLTSLFIALALCATGSHSLQCKYVRRFFEAATAGSIECASFLPVCYEKVYPIGDDDAELEYTAHCGKPTECHDMPKDNCRICRKTDNCNTKLLHRVLKRNHTCQKYEGQVRSKKLTNGRTLETMKFKVSHAHCITDEEYCYRVKYSEPAPGYPTDVYSEGDPIYMSGGCGRVSCSGWGHTISCQFCTGTMCNSPTGNLTPKFSKERLKSIHQSHPSHQSDEVASLSGSSLFVSRGLISLVVTCATAALRLIKRF